MGGPGSGVWYLGLGVCSSFCGGSHARGLKRDYWQDDPPDSAANLSEATELARSGRLREYSPRTVPFYRCSEVTELVKYTMVVARPSLPAPPSRLQTPPAHLNPPRLHPDAILTCPHPSPGAPHHLQHLPASASSLLALASLLHIPVLCFQHLLSTLQKNSTASFVNLQTNVLEPQIYVTSSPSSFGLFYSLCSLLHTPALCFQHFLSTLQKNPACRAGRDTAWFAKLNPMSSNLKSRTLRPHFLSLRLFCSLCSLLHTPALCFQHLLSTLQKNATAWFANLNLSGLALAGSAQKSQQLPGRGC